MYAVTITLKPRNFTHRRDLSCYNVNLYQDNTRGTLIKEICHEDESYYDYYLIRHTGEEIHLGSVQSDCYNPFLGFDEEEIVLEYGFAIT